MMTAASIGAVVLTGCHGRGDSHAVRSETASNRRKAAIAAARVWTPPSTSPEAVDFGANTPGMGFIDAADDVDCDFRLEPIGGTTPKFYCTMRNGDRVKVKYGAENPEILAAVAASRLMSALGFAVDRMMLVHSVRCHGCPPFPAQALACLQRGALAGACLEGASQSNVVTFDVASIERPFAGEALDDEGGPGWAWFELDGIDPAAGGSSRAEVDALRLMAVLLAHWDNKAENQRLVCRGGRGPDGSCRAPYAVLHDLGATFGPLKMDLQNWRQAPMWADPSRCRVNMATLPFKGGTFPEHAISEEGRQLALKLLRPITAAQLHRLFEASGVSRYASVLAAARDPQSWTTAFLAKVEAIDSAGPCETAAALRARGE
jgi:hypothetical protein